MKESMDRNDKVFDIILEEAFDKYAKDVADYEPETEMAEEDIRIMEDKKDNIYNNIMKEIDKDKKKKSPLKLIIPLVAVLILVLAYSTNTFAFRTFLHQTFMSLTGTDLNVKTKKLVFEDYSNITNFESKEEIIIPNWLPEGMELERVVDEAKYLLLHYKYNECWVSISTKLAYDEDVSKIETENNDYVIRKENVLDMDCRIVEMVSETGLTMRAAYWSSKDLNYTLLTNISEDDFNKVLKKLQYLED